MSAPRGPRHGPRRGLRWRMALYLAVLTAVLYGATAGLLGRRITQRLELDLQAELDARLRVVDDALAGTSSRIESTLGRLERRLRGQADGGTRALLLAAPDAVPVAAEWMELTGLELLTVLDSEGMTVSSGHWPERAGLADPGLAGLHEGRTVFVSTAWPDEDRLALLVTRRVRIASHEWMLIGGLAIDTILAARFDEDVAWSFDYESPSAIDLPEDGPAVVALARRDGPDRAATDHALYARRVLGGPGAEEAGAIVVAAERSSVRATLREMVNGMVVAGILVTLLGALAGVWIAGRIDRPVRQLVRAVDAIGAGEADYTFPRTTRDEFEELEQAFSRLQRSLERQKQRSAAAERVAAWQEVARHVAHEVKNPLAPIRLTVENLVRARRENPQLFEELFDDGATTILEEVEQLRQLVQEFSAFARLPPPKPRRTELHALIDGVLELYSAEPGLQVHKDYAYGLPALQVDPDQISRVLKNVIGNAVEAMRETDPGADRRLDLQTWLESDMVVIQVTDSGPGLTPEARESIFRPYFTTKSQGTGLGMAIAQRIVSEHGGLLAVENRAGHGACLSIRLPRTAMGPAPGASEA